MTEKAVSPPSSLNGTMTEGMSAMRSLKRRPTPNCRLPNELLVLKGFVLKKKFDVLAVLRRLKLNPNVGATVVCPVFVATKPTLPPTPKSHDDLSMSMLGPHTVASVTSGQTKSAAVPALTLYSAPPIPRMPLALASEPLND